MLTLYGHPISSYTWKVLTALYENATAFRFVTLDQDTYPDFIARWPLGTFPVLFDSDRERMITETSVIIEYLDTYHPGAVRFVPQDIDTALEVRRWDRILDNVGTTMTKVVTDNIRQEGQHDPVGVDDAKRIVRKLYTVIEAQLGDRPFIVGDNVTLADASAAPSLWYATRNIPLDGAFPKIAAYLERLKAWPAFARAVKESEPLFHIYPGA